MSVRPDLGNQQSVGTAGVNDVLTALKNAVIAINGLQAQLVKTNTELTDINASIQALTAQTVVNTAALVAAIGVIP